MNRLGFLIVSATLLAFGQCQDLHLSAEPSNVVNGSTDSLKITCRAPQLDRDTNLFILLQVDRQGDDDTTPIASERGTGTVLHVEDNRTSAEGALQGNDGAFLTVSIASPEYEDTGFYKCRFAYLNMAEFKFTLLNKTFEVTFTEPDEPTPAPVIPESCSCDQVWAEVKNLRETLIAENRELRQQLMSYDDSCRVSFSAKLADRSGREFHSNDVLVFDSVIANKGEAYDVSNGVFTAPCSGQYYFRLSLRTHQENDSGHVDGAIEVNGEQMARTSVFTADHMDHYEQASNGLVLSLEKGDEVQVRIQTNSAGQLMGDVYTIFSGFFISP